MVWCLVHGWHYYICRDSYIRRSSYTGISQRSLCDGVPDSQSGLYVAVRLFLALVFYSAPQVPWVTRIVAVYGSNYGVDLTVYGLHYVDSNLDIWLYTDPKPLKMCILAALIAAAAHELVKGTIC